MKAYLYKTKYLLFLLILLNLEKLKSQDFSTKNISDQQSQIFIESTNQSSDMENSIFYAEGAVIITNEDKGFIAKSKKAIFYKLSSKIKLIGDVEVTTRDSGTLSAGEIIYYLNENRFEAVSDSNQRVNTRFVVNENKILKELKE